MYKSLEGSIKQIYIKKYDFFFDKRGMWSFALTRSPGQCAKRPLHIGWVKLGLSPMGMVPMNCFHSKGRTLSTIKQTDVIKYEC
jgi:hypothetical protein